MLEQYADRNGLGQVVHYTDDGYSGANFDRPAWKRMMEDVEAGKIGTILVKDMSRVGRNYLESERHGIPDVPYWHPFDTCEISCKTCGVC